MYKPFDQTCSTIKLSLEHLKAYDMPLEVYQSAELADPAPVLPAARMTGSDQVKYGMSAASVTKRGLVPHLEHVSYVANECTRNGICADPLPLLVLDLHSASLLLVNSQRNSAKSAR